MDFDLSEGLTFENVTDQYVFSTNSLAINKCDLSRVAYEDTMLEDVDDSFGEYCLVGDATGAIWPAFTLKFDMNLQTRLINLNNALKKYIKENKLETANQNSSKCF